MKSWRSMLLWVMALSLVAVSLAGCGDSQDSVPTVEDPLVISAALDLDVVEPLLEAFRDAYPEIPLSFIDRSTLEVDRSVVAGSASADPSEESQPGGAEWRAEWRAEPPDVVISSA
ncbi:MAG: hypothetical protein VX259_01140, partial [Pseudomonadota bacterium]|nr:hypothetical protein [Pseudomonadota bacterium]